MKKVVGTFAALAGCLTINAQAQGLFIGGEAGVTTYPGFASFAVVAHSTAAGIYGGQWLNENWGWEAALTNLGSVETTGAGTADHKHAASALSTAALGGFKLGRGSVYGKIGLYRASVKYDSPALSVTTTTTNFVIGGGYTMSFAERLVGKVELEIYDNVKFQTPNAPAGATDSGTINKLSVGMAYAF